MDEQYDMQEQSMAIGMMLGQDNPDIIVTSLDFEQMDKLIQDTYGIVIPRGTDLKTARQMVAEHRMKEDPSA